MKKLLLLFFLNVSILFAQENEPYILRFHYMEVSSGQNEFINANKTYFKKLAEQAVKDKKWAGWDMMQSVIDPNQFLFIHHYNSPEQYENAKNIFSGEVAKKLGLKTPDWSSWQAIGKPFEFWQIISNAIGETNSNYFIKNEFKSTNGQKFIENNKLWGEMVVKPQLDDVDGLNWAFGIKLMDNHWEDGKMASFNGISFDGFDSLNSLMKANSYNENSTPNKLIEKFSKEVQKRELNDFASARKTSVWKVIDNTWN